MAFMALFGWIIFLLIPIALVLMALEAALTWAVAHIMLVNGIFAALLVGNLLIFGILLKVRARWKREGRWKSSPAWENWDWKEVLGRFFLLTGIVWEIFAVLFFLACLIFQPIPRLAGLFL